MLRTTVLTAAIVAFSVPVWAACGEDLRQFNREYERHEAHLLQMDAEVFRQRVRDMTQRAANLMEEGEEERCRQLVGEMQALLSDQHEQYVEWRETAIAAPGEIKAWRMEAAQPLGELSERMPLQRLLFADVYLKDGARVGSLLDFVVHPDTGEVTYAIVAVGGLLQIDKQVKAVSLDLLQVTPQMEAVVLPMEEDEVANLPFYTGQDVDLAGRR